MALCDHTEHGDKACVRALRAAAACTREVLPARGAELAPGAVGAMAGRARGSTQQYARDKAEDPRRPVAGGDLRGRQSIRR